MLNNQLVVTYVAQSVVTQRVQNISAGKKLSLDTNLQSVS